MANTDREFRALSAYINLMRSKGATEANLDHRKKFLVPLAELLGEQAHDSVLFRKHVDTVLEQCAKTDWPFFLTVAREYYPFWTDDIKAIAALNASGGYAIEPIMPPVHTKELKALWQNLDKEQFSVTEKWPLKAYAAALRDAGAAPELIETRTRLVKLMLLRLRAIDTRDSAHYRAAVEATLPLFNLKDARDVFMTVIREFFYFWEGNPNASDYLQLPE
jgi:hypothetical protein